MAKKLTSDRTIKYSDKPKPKYHHYLIGHKYKGIRELNKDILPKFRAKKLEETIDKITDQLRECFVIEFDDSPNVYVGAFVHTDKNSETLIKASKDYKDAIKKIELDFNRIGMSMENLIMEDSILMK